MINSLNETIELMTSSDYKDRFKAEYIQLYNRLHGLKRMLESWDKGTLNFTPTCPRDLYDKQVSGMVTYLNVLAKGSAPSSTLRPLW